MAKTLAALLLIAAAIAGCGRTPEARLTVALAIFPGEAARYRVFAAEFEQRSGLQIRLVAQAYGDILRALEAGAGARHGSLDLVELDLAMLARARGRVRELDPLITASARALFPEAAWEAGSANGHVYFVPHRLMWQALVYNRIEVPSPPATWDDLRRFARVHPGKLALKGALYEGAICDVMPFVWSAGGDELEPGSHGSLRALEFLGSLAADLNPESAVFREMSVLEAQARGSVWIHLNWPFAMSYLQSKGLAPEVNLSAPVPAGPQRPATVLGGGYLAIPASAPHPEAAAAFIRYLLTPAAQRRLSQQLGWYGSVPPPAGSEQALIYAGFTAMRPYVHARPVIDCYAVLSDRWQRAIRSVLFDGEGAAGALGTITPISAASASRCRCD